MWLLPPPPLQILASTVVTTRMCQTRADLHPEQSRAEQSWAAWEATTLRGMGHDVQRTDFSLDVLAQG